VHALLIELIRCLKLKCLHSYFIPSNNLLDHLIDVNISHDISAIQGVCEDFRRILSVLDFCIEEELYMTNAVKLFTVPQSLTSSYRVFSSVYNIFDNFTDVLRAREDAQLIRCMSETLSANYKLLHLNLKPVDVSLGDVNCGATCDTL